MLNIALVAVGGAVGAALRYLMSGAMFRQFGDAWPYGTFAINVLGSFLIGLLGGRRYGRAGWSQLGGQCSGQFRASPGNRYAPSLPDPGGQLPAVARAESPRDHWKQWQDEHEGFRCVGAGAKISGHQNRREFQQSRRLAAHNSGSDFRR